MKDVACMRVQESGSRSAHSGYASLSVSLAGAGALLASIVLTASSLAQPQGWPQRPVKVLVPFAAGGNIDLMGRLAAARLSETFAQQFVVENRVGGNGVIATEAVARARPDGYTLLWASTSVIAIFPAISKVNYDPVKDLAPISLFAVAPQVLIVNPRLPVHDVPEFVAYVKSQKEKLAYGGGGGPGSASNLLMALFLKQAGLEMSNVSYRGTAPAMTDLIAGHIPAMFAPISEVLPQARAGLVRMLGVSSSTRSLEAPDVSAIAEAGYPNFHAVSWTGMMAPAATPVEIIDRMAAEFARALTDPEFVAHMRRAGVEPAKDASPTAFAAFIRREIALWGEAVRIAGVSLQ
jgi:tripartite-type tricarboxylate transporter receptor subunit TctC